MMTHTHTHTNTDTHTQRERERDSNEYPIVVFSKNVTIKIDIGLIRARGIED